MRRGGEEKRSRKPSKKRHRKLSSSDVSDQKIPRDETPKLVSEDSRLEDTSPTNRSSSKNET